MKATTLSVLALALSASAAFAQNAATGTETGGTPSKDTTVAAPPVTPSLFVPISIQHARPNDIRGLNVFETPKAPGAAWTGFKLDVGAAFTQQFQGLSHSNAAQAVTKTGTDGKPYNANQLIVMGHGFNNAVANLYVNAQLAKGIRVALTQYLSARHHQETWVKDGYFLIDASPFDNALLTKMMEYTTIKIGHYEINYGDQHFRRTDNGNAFFNPFVGNLIMDAFSTEIGAEVMLRAKGFQAMGAVHNGESRGTILNAPKRAPAFIGKLGYDNQFTPDLRLRLTGSIFSQARATSQTLYSGDRGGSRYYDVLENVVSTEKDQAWSGAVNPAMNQQHAYVINPFIQFKGLEYFGNYEKATGKNLTETVDRSVKQNSSELVYRFLENKLWVGGRYNTVNGRLAAQTQDFDVTRTQYSAGWYVLPTLNIKGEIVKQEYKGFAPTDIRNGGKFNGFMLEATVAF